MLIYCFKTTVTLYFKVRQTFYIYKGDFFMFNGNLHIFMKFIENKFFMIKPQKFCLKCSANLNIVPKTNHYLPTCIFCVSYKAGKRLFK